MSPDWEGFGRAIMTLWPEGAIDGWELEVIATEYGILREERYNIEQHGTHGRDELGMNEGELWYVRNYDEEANNDSAS